MARAPFTFIDNIMNNNIMKRIMIFVSLSIFVLSLKAETVAVFNDNGEGGIHKSMGTTIIVDGQYYIDINVPTYNGRTRKVRMKVYRVKDYARLLYHQDKWAEKYVYVALDNRNGTYYFNMKSRWIPSLTESKDDPNRVVPIKKIIVYRDEFVGQGVPDKMVLIKANGQYMLYWGDDFFCARIYPNDGRNYDMAPWAHKFKYCAEISGFTVYFNIGNK